MARHTTSFTGVIYRDSKTNGKADKTYYIRYKDIDNKTKEVKLGKFSEGIRENYCNRIRNEYLTKVRLGEVPPAALKNTKVPKNLLDTIADEYFNQRKDNKITKADRNIYKSYIKPYFEDIDKITKTQLVKWKVTLKSLYRQKDPGQKLSIKYTNDIQNLLITINRYALRNDLTKNDFGKYIIKDELDNSRERFLTKEEIKILYDYTEHDISLFLFYKIALNTGARLTSVLHISKKDIDFSNKVMTIKDFKNNSTYKTFVNDDLLTLLKENTKGFTLDEKLFKSNHQRRLRDTLDFLFNGDLDKYDTKNRVVVHTLRHTFASHLAINGTPIYTIQKLMNHKDIKMTLRYAKLSPDSGRDAVVSLGF